MTLSTNGSPTGDGDGEYDLYTEKRRMRMKIVAWTVIIALVLVGGGSTVIALLFG
ncbi:MAG: hypothetical protein K0R60_1775 [Microbacterium sp.]|nr:hypothetical protein [Microbacterium sp.]